MTEIRQRFISFNTFLCAVMIVLLRNTEDEPVKL